MTYGKRLALGLTIGILMVACSRTAFDWIMATGSPRANFYGHGVGMLTGMVWVWIVERVWQGYKHA